MQHCTRPAYNGDNIIESKTSPTDPAWLSEVATARSHLHSLLCWHGLLCKVINADWAKGSYVVDARSAKQDKAEH